MQPLNLAFSKNVVAFKCVSVVPRQVMEFLKKLAGAEYVGFCNAT